MPCSKDDLEFRLFRTVRILFSYCPKTYRILSAYSFVCFTKYVHIKSTTVYAPRRNWDSPQPPTRRLVLPLPPVSGGRGTLAGEKGVGRVPIPTRGIHCGTLYMYVLCGLFVYLRMLPRKFWKCRRYLSFRKKFGILNLCSHIAVGKLYIFYSR
jgi:hypothetical protein